jgi:orotate phosphoribosyltransferase
MERGSGSQSATQEVRSQFGIPVISIATLEDLTAFLGARADMARQLQAVERYRKEYGVSA